jgi:oligoribonuclease (3'-5' exoribonuclease)
MSDFVFVEVQTTGTNEVIDYILEIGIALVDLQGNVLDSKSWLMPPCYRPKIAAVERARKDSLMGHMHTESGLWKELGMAEDLTEMNVESEAINYLIANVKDTAPMTGSYVQYSRRFLNKYMPLLHDWFEPGDIDIATISELCEKLNPKVYARVPALSTRMNRVIPDIHAAATEYQFYKKNFLKAR